MVDKNLNAKNEQK